MPACTTAGLKVLMEQQKLRQFKFKYVHKYKYALIQVYTGVIPTNNKLNRGKLIARRKRVRKRNHLHSDRGAKPTRYLV